MGESQLPGDAAGPVRHHGNRHGRSEDARRAVIRAADDLLVERGFAGVTIEGIAARAGVAKQTIYRWWGSKVDVLLDTFLEDATEQLAPPDNGTVRSDLTAYLRQLAAFLTEDDAGAVLRALVGQAQHDPGWRGRPRATGPAQEPRAGDARPRGGRASCGGLDLDEALDRLVGPVYHRSWSPGTRRTRGHRPVRRRLSSPPCREPAPVPPDQA